MNLTAARALREPGNHAEACAMLIRLAAQTPGDAEIQLETARVHDFLGREAQAVPYYRAALSGRLPDELRRGAYLGLGSTYRTLGKYAAAERTLLEGLSQFPDANDLKVFLAMVQHNLGKSKQAVEALLMLLAETTSDESIRQYGAAISLYGKDIDRVWPE